MNTWQMRINFSIEINSAVTAFKYTIIYTNPIGGKKINVQQIEHKFI